MSVEVAARGRVEVKVVIAVAVEKPRVAHLRADGWRRLNAVAHKFVIVRTMATASGGIMRRRSLYGSQGMTQLMGCCTTPPLHVNQRIHGALIIEILWAR